MQNQAQKNKAAVIRICSVILWMALIFFFSQQDAAESSAASGKAAEILGWILRTFFPGMEEGRVESIIRTSVFWIRKGAHMSVYFVLSLLLFDALSAFSLSGKKRYISAFLIAVLYSLSDELHQYFVSGRSCELRDVLIDSAGALAALLLTKGISRLRMGRAKNPAPSQIRPYIIFGAVVLIFVFSVFFSLFSAADAPL